MRWLRVPVCFLALIGVAHTQDQPYPVFEKDKIPAAEHKDRRDRFMTMMNQDGAAVLFTNPERNRSNSTDFKFRPDSDFWYLTGFEEPDAALLLVPKGLEVDGKTVREVLFVNDRNPGVETWIGYRMGPANAQRILGFEAVLSNTRFAATLAQLKGRSVHEPNIALGPTGTLAQMIAQHGAAGFVNIRPRVDALTGRMRVLKSPAELKLMRRAVEISGIAHVEALRSAEPGMREWEIGSLVEYIFGKYGAQHTAYGSIVGCGPNSTILHYNTNRGPMTDGKIVCMDVGAEYHGYAADITRSYPVNGKFSPAQKAIYEIVLAAQLAGIKECREGKPFGATHQAATKIIQDGLIRLGIIKNASEVGRYFMHGTSHYVGLDVHDPQTDPVLRPNYVLTVEPGIYIKSGSPCDPKWWDIGIRIEDCILVTSGDPVVMSSYAPKTITGIEALMKEKGMGNMNPKPYGPSANQLREILLTPSRG